MEISELAGKRAALVVAHPDDEVMWAGGLLLATPETKWTIICCSIPRIDPVRAWKFFKVCDTVGAIAKLIPLEETGPNQLLNPDAGHIIAGEDWGRYDFAFTHNEHGEYGHRHHQQVSLWVRSNHRPQRLFVFGYGLTGTPSLSVTSSDWTGKEALLAHYNHMTFYDGHWMMKCQALWQRYFQTGEVSRTTETFYECF